MNNKQAESSRLMLSLIIIMGMTPPLASDLYLPGMPAMTQELHASQSLAAQTVTVFFLFMSFGAFFIGPLCDKYGRKPIRIICAAVAVLSSAACAAATNIWLLLICRAVQGISGGGLLSISTTLVKDCYSGDKIAKVLGIVQATSMVVPVVAPLIGAGLLAFSGWRGIFVFMAIVFFISLILSVITPETLDDSQLEPCDMDNANASIKDSGTNEMMTYLKAPSFMLPLLAGDFFCAAFSGYLGVASFVYEDYYGMTASQFSVVFSITSVASLAGPLVYMKLSAHVNTEILMKFMYAGIIISAIGLIMFGGRTPYGFMIAALILVFCSSLVRPMISNYILQPLTSGVGSASAILNFLYGITGCIGMAGASIGFGTVVFGVQLTVLMTGGLSLILWIAHIKRQKRFR